MGLVRKVDAGALGPQNELVGLRSIHDARACAVPSRRSRVNDSFIGPRCRSIKSNSGASEPDTGTTGSAIPSLRALPGSERSFTAASGMCFSRT